MHYSTLLMLLALSLQTSYQESDDLLLCKLGNDHLDQLHCTTPIHLCSKCTEGLGWIAHLQCLGPLPTPLAVDAIFDHGISVLILELVHVA